MQNFLIKLIFFSMALSLASCSTNTPQENKALGGVTGAAAGGALGGAAGQGTATTALIGTGALVGALIGASFGNPMDSSDKEKAYEALATGKPATWQNPQTKVSYTIIPAANYVTLHGNPDCRRFVAIQIIDNHARKIYRSACREPKGTWEFVR